MRRITTYLSALIVSFYATTATAFAQESGAGQIHATEKTITEFGLGLIVGFPIFVWAMSRLQKLGDNRKDRKRPPSVSPRAPQHGRAAGTGRRSPAPPTPDRRLRRS